MNLAVDAKKITHTEFLVDPKTDIKSLVQSTKQLSFAGPGQILPKNSARHALIENVQNTAENGLQLTADALSKLNQKDWDGFVRLCGTGFVRTIQYGGHIAGSIHIKNWRSQRMEALNITASGGAPSFDVNASFYKSVRDLEQGGSASVFAQGLGTSDVTMVTSLDSLKKLYEDLNREVTSKTSKALSYTVVPYMALPAVQRAFQDKGLVLAIDSIQSQLIRAYYRLIDLDRRIDEVLNSENSYFLTPDTSRATLRAIQVENERQRREIVALANTCTHQKMKCSIAPYDKFDDYPKLMALPAPLPDQLASLPPGIKDPSEFSSVVERIVQTRLAARYTTVRQRRCDWLARCEATPNPDLAVRERVLNGLTKNWVPVPFDVHQNGCSPDVLTSFDMARVDPPQGPGVHLIMHNAVRFYCLNKVSTPGSTTIFGINHGTFTFERDGHGGSNSASTYFGIWPSSFRREPYRKWTDSCPPPEVMIKDERYGADHPVKNSIAPGRYIIVLAAPTDIITYGVAGAYSWDGETYRINVDQLEIGPLMPN
jgi:hypothetical protein